MDRVEKIMDMVLKMDFIEETFSDIAVQRPDIEENKLKDYHDKVETFFSQQTPECKEAALSMYISRCSEANYHQLTVLYQTLDLLVKANILSSRSVCEQILGSEKLDYKQELFFVESFKMIKRLIGGVDYKGVREIMKQCREKVNNFPVALSISVLNQITSVADVLKYIFDRKACLLPAYFIITELQKQENADVHWKISTLTSNFIEEFTGLAQMLSIIGHSSMLPILEPASASGYGDTTNPWRLDPNLKFTTLKGNLPYDAELTQPQVGLLRYVLQQLYSKEMVCSMLNLQKQRSAVLEEQLVWMIVHAMEKSEQESSSESKIDPHDSTPSHKEWLWLHFSSQLIYFVLFQCATFPNIVNELHEKLSSTNLRKGRDDLMWALLQYISGSIQRNALSNFLPVLKLYEILYNEKEPLPVPDVKHPSSTKKIAATCIYIHLLKKAQLENIAIRPIPIALRKHYEFLQQLSASPNLTIGDDYIVTLLCNAYSTNQEYFSRPMTTLIDTILLNNKPQTQANQQALTTAPLSMIFLDSLTVHSKMSIIHCVVNNLMKQAEAKGTMVSNMTPSHVAPALVETYSRLLVYTEIESLGIKGFLSRLLPTVCKSNAWSILYTLLEMFSYRLFHIQAHYRSQLLLQLHNLTQNSHINSAQLHLCFESTALRLLTGLGSAEFQFQLSRFFTEPKNLSSIVSNDNEELNRVLILTMARSIHITGMGDVRITSGDGGGNNMYLMDLLQMVMKNTPHSWAQHTRVCFPKVLSEFYANHNVPVEDKQMLKKSIEEEYRNFMSMSNENDTISYFSQRPLFLCLLFKLISDTGEISPIAYKVLERIGARLFSAQLRTLCDFLLFEVMRRSEIPKLVDSMNDMIWKWNIVTIDRLVLCLALRTQEQNQVEMPTAQVFVIQLLLIKNSHFRDRVIKFVESNSPEYWKQSNWHEKHAAFHNEYPEKFAPDEHSQVLPVYFGNVCLRFLPVLDIVIHRYLEMSVETTAPLESILKTLGCLYKFHDRPITYLYNTLFYYEAKLRDRLYLKKVIVSTIILSLKDVREKSWALTEQYQIYVKNTLQDDSSSMIKWVPDLSYYMSLVKRLIETIEGGNIFPNVDWRFNEFPNPPTHALYVTAVELLGLPVLPHTAANLLFDVIVKGLVVISYQHIHTWINAIGLITAALPESYWSVIYDRLEEIICHPQMKEWTYRQSPFDMFNFNTVKCALLDHKFVMHLAIAHSIFHHFNIGQTSKIVTYIKEKLVPHIRTEYQLLYLHHIVGPFLQRLDPKDVIEITKVYYELLELVDKNIGEENNLEFMDPICDMLYHIKYMFVGDSMKTDLEPIIKRLSNPLKSRLRFITRLGVEEIKTEVKPPVVATAAEQSPMMRAQHQPMPQQQQQKIARI